MRDFTHADRVAMHDPAFAVQYERAAGHDGRYDGHFVIGHRVSEIFCRPGCATRTSRPSQVRFYPTAAAAMDAGLIPCPRCRPERVCALPSLGAADSVAERALGLIADGEVDRTGIEGLADKVGASSRHVRRAVERRAGCGPLVMARATRTYVARLIFESTAIPMADVAVATGFSTTRQFNLTIKRFYRVTPSALRAGAGHSRRPRYRASTAGSAEPLVVRCEMPVRQPFDSAGLFRHLAAQAIPDVEHVGRASYARAMRLPFGVGHVRVDCDHRRRIWASLTVADPRDLLPLYARTRQLFDLDADPIVVDAVLLRDPALAPSVTARPGARVSGAIDTHEMVIRAMVGWQIPAASARIILGGATARLGGVTPWGLTFPDPGRIADDGRAVLRGSAARIDAVIALAMALADRALVVHRGLTHQQLSARLAPYVDGGVPAADYVAARVLGSPDFLPARDENVLGGAKYRGLPTDPAELAGYAVRWAPWRSYAAMHLR